MDQDGPVNIGVKSGIKFYKYYSSQDYMTCMKHIEFLDISCF